MAGVGKNAVIVDVVAAAKRVAAKNVAEHPWADPHHDVLADVKAAKSEAGEKAADVFSMALVECALGHRTDPNARFCSTCGLPMGVDAPDVTADTGRPKPASQLTAEELRSRAEQHAAVIAANARAEQLVQDIEQQPDDSEKKILIHFVSDGFTFAGRVWNIGDQLEIGPEHERWPQVVQWITLTKRQQVERWGKVFFDNGPWPYDTPAPGTELPLPSLGGERLFQMRRRQGSGVPGTPGENNSLIPR